MKYRLGLDLGTNSIGWALISLSAKNEPCELVDTGTRIFSDGREPKTGEPLALARRTARSIRRNLRRRKARRKALFRLLQRDGLFPANIGEARLQKALDPYRLRVKALDEKLAPFELGRALFHLGVRRGFKSNRKDAPEEALPEESSADLFGADEADGTDSAAAESPDAAEEMRGKPKEPTQGEKCLALKAAIAESGLRTLGEFLFAKANDAPGGQKALRFVAGRYRWYPLRELYEAEFDAIRAAQEPDYPDIAWDDIRQAIFDQRPLRKQERGQCQFTAGCPFAEGCPGKTAPAQCEGKFTPCERTFKAMPSAIRFRILQETANLTLYDERGTAAQPLDDAQRKIVIAALDASAKDVSFDALRKKLKLPQTCSFNLEKDARSSLKGNPTGTKLRGAKCFGKLWDTLPLAEQDGIVGMLIECEDEAAILAALAKYDLTDEQKKAIARYIPAGGTTSLCKELTQRLVAKMAEKNCGYVAALDALGIKHSEERVDKYDTLPYYGEVLTGAVMGADAKADKDKYPEKYYGKIANPTVHIALRQTEKVVNTLISVYGKPAQVVIELSRDLKASREDKARMLKKQAENTKRNAIINKNIKEITEKSAMPIRYPNRTDRLKYRLWEELGKDGMTRRCLYCGKNISASELFTDNIEIEHILPSSRTLLDAESNKTVAHKRCNAFKGDRSPYEAFASNPPGYNWEDICERAGSLSASKRRRFSADAMKDFEEQTDGGKGFIARQLTDNAYLSKIARRYIKAVCDDVWVTSGRMTAHLRGKWELDSILKRKIGQTEIAHFKLDEKQIGEYKKNRYDHRHHALDAIVIGLVDRAMVQKIATMHSRAQEERIEVEMPFGRNRAESKAIIADKLKSLVVSFKPDHGVQGKLSKETALGKIKMRNEKTGELEEVYVNRTPLAGLKEKNIDDIVDAKIRKALREFVQAHSGEKFEKVLEQFSQETGIRRVRCKTFAQKPIVIPEAHHDNPAYTRYYNPEDYLCAVVWQLPPDKSGKCKFEAQYVRRTEIDKSGNPILARPHPAAKKICVLFKDDYVEFTESGVTKKARIGGFSATNNGIDIRPIYATDDAKNWIVATPDVMREKGWKPQKGHNFISVNVLFGQYAARKITVSPIGRVR